MKKTTMQKYARLIARKGINVQKNQEVIVNASLEQPEFVKMVVEECYRAGAKKVTVEWSYQPLTKLNYRYRSMKTLSTIEKWEEEGKILVIRPSVPLTIGRMEADPKKIKEVYELGRDDARRQIEDMKVFLGIE